MAGEGDVLAEALPGGGLAFPGATVAVPSDSELDYPEEVKGGEPIRRGAILDLPIAGLITMSLVADLSIELTAIQSGTVEYCIHFGGLIEVTGSDGDTWHGHGDADHRASLARVLDLVGGQIIWRSHGRGEAPAPRVRGRNDCRRGGGSMGGRIGPKPTGSTRSGCHPWGRTSRSGQLCRANAGGWAKSPMAKPAAEVRVLRQGLRTWWGCA